jgi:hypothetical protein
LTAGAPKKRLLQLCPSGGVVDGLEDDITPDYSWIASLDLTRVEIEGALSSIRMTNCTV